MLPSRWALPGFGSPNPATIDLGTCYKLIFLASLSADPAPMGSRFLTKKNLAIYLILTLNKLFLSGKN